MLRPLALLALLLTSACATVTTGTTQSVTITSDPTGASCRLERDGATVGVVNPTPGSVSISRSTRDLTVRCERAGHQPGIRTISASFQAMTLGYILLGGVVGIVVDAASGAVGQYEPNIHVVLPPGQFGSTGSRDAWFEEQRRALVAQYDERIAAVRATCEAHGQRRSAQQCNQAVEALLAQRDVELRVLERQRASSPGA